MITIAASPSSLLKKVFEVSRWATLIQDPSARRTKDSQPSGFGFEYCASHVGFRVFQQTARLLYLADVPVESYMHGSSLVYRLFESYPAEKLLIVEGLYESQADRRLPNVQYCAIKSSLSRLLKNPFSHYLWPLSLARVYLSSRSISRIVRSYRPQAVITVVVRQAWEAAASYATRADLPLHLIVHDDWPNNPTCT